jgi:hypothetical protein
VPTHNNQYRLSLLTGEQAATPNSVSQPPSEHDIRELLTVTDSRVAHERWLATDVAAAYNESVYHPYTSLKYHTLLVAALLDNYRAGHRFANLQLVVDPAGEVVPYRTVFAGERFTLRLDCATDGRPAARLGDQPRRCWSRVWNRLSAHPLDTSHDTYDRTLDANLQRIQSWSTALQYLEDYAAWSPDR